jgi:hypothetical protein
MCPRESSSRGLALRGVVDLSVTGRARRSITENVLDTDLDLALAVQIREEAQPPDLPIARIEIASVRYSPEAALLLGYFALAVWD